MIGLLLSPPPVMKDAVLAQNNIQYSWPEDMQQFRYKLALAIEHNDVDYFFKRPEL